MKLHRLKLHLLKLHLLKLHIETTPIVYTDVDVVSLDPNIEVKVRKGKHIFEMAKYENDKINFDQCLETALEI